MNKQKIIGFVLAVIGFAVAVSFPDPSSLQIFLDSSWSWSFRSSQFFVAFANFFMGIILGISGIILFSVPKFLE